ncbi:MAG: hypothetical protein ACTSXV_00160, partial [Alphaproteobacteria bacterium]
MSLYEDHTNFIDRINKRIKSVVNFSNLINLYQDLLSEDIDNDGKEAIEKRIKGISLYIKEEFKKLNKTKKKASRLFNEAVGNGYETDTKKINKLKAIFEKSIENKVDFFYSSYEILFKEDNQGEEKRNSNAFDQL